MFPKFSRCYAKQRSTDCELAEAYAAYISELADVIEHKPYGYVSWWNIANMATRPMLDLDNCHSVSQSLSDQQDEHRSSSCAKTSREIAVLLKSLTDFGHTRNG